MNLTDFAGEARLMAATYGLAGHGLAPALPAGFPVPAGFEFDDWFDVTDKVLWFKETTFTGLHFVSPSADYFAFIGTHNAEEWAEDMEALPHDWVFLDGTHCEIETGFRQFYTEIFFHKTGQPLQDYVRTLAQAGRKSTWLGHSLGTQPPKIAAADLYGAQVVAFAAPKTGNQAFADRLRSRVLLNSASIRNLADLVPDTPDAIYYQRELTELTFERDYPDIADPFKRVAARHSMADTYCPACQLPAA